MARGIYRDDVRAKVLKRTVNRLIFAAGFDHIKSPTRWETGKSVVEFLFFSPSYRGVQRGYNI